MFIPTTQEDMAFRGWDSLDVILVSGDTYTDNSYNGAAVIGHWLIDNGFKVGIIAQPSMDGPEDITRLGQPNLFWSVSAGCVDSMVANHTPTGKFRKDDDFTPGGVNDRRPDRATIAYTNLIKQHANGRPIFLAGIEASLRRVAHYDCWTDSIRRSVLLDAKADGIVYGMAELSTLQLAQCLRDGKDWHDIRGICYVSSEAPVDAIVLPSFEDCESNRDAFHRAFRLFSENCDPVTARTIVQPHGGRYLVHNRPQRNLRPEELDAVHESDYENAVHPYYLAQGPVKAMETVRNSITTHRGCYGGCSFCAIAAHQGRAVVSRSEASIVREVERMARNPSFNGTIQDVGGPTANMYGIDCLVKGMKGACTNKRCLGNNPCKLLGIDHGRQIEMLRKVRNVPGVRKVFVNSGIRYDMILADVRNGQRYLDSLVANHVSGQMKVAPEHISKDVLKAMGKCSAEKLLEFKKMFEESNARCGKDQFLTYYFIAAHPGCTEEHMRELSAFCREELHTNPEQVQIFTPTPSTESTLMFCTGKDVRGKQIRSEHSVQRMQRQKDIVVLGNDAVPPEVHDTEDRALHSGKTYDDRSRGFDNRRRNGGRRDDRQHGGRKPYGDKPRFDRRNHDDVTVHDGAIMQSVSDEVITDESSGDKPRFDRDREDRPRFDRDKKPYGDKPRFDRDKKPYGDKPRFDGERKPYGDKPRFDRDKKPYGDKPRFDGDREDRPRFDRDKKPYGDKPRFDRDRKPYGDKPRYDRDKKPYVDKPRFDRDREDRPRTSGNDEARSDRPEAPKKPFGGDRYSNKPKGGKLYGKPSGGRDGGGRPGDRPYKKPSQPYSGKRDFDRDSRPNKRKDGRR